MSGFIVRCIGRDTSHSREWRFFSRRVFVQKAPGGSTPQRGLRLSDIDQERNWRTLDGQEAQGEGSQCLQVGLREVQFGQRHEVGEAVGEAAGGRAAD